MSQMPALVKYSLEPKAVEVRDVPVPSPSAEEVLLRVAAVGICGSDVHQYHNTQSWPMKLPVVMGHEFCGKIEALGKQVRGFSEGDLVVSETAAEIDENSPLTRAGQYNLDPHRMGFGAARDGAMARFVRVPARCLHRLPAGLAPEIGALTEPCCVAYQATVIQTRVRPGDIVVVVGPGPIGILSAQLARLCGAGQVILAGIGRDAARLKIGLGAGATLAVNIEAENLSERLKAIGDGLGADVVIDAAGVSAALKSALEWVRPAGQITKVGWGPQPLGFSLDPLVQKAVTLRGSFSHNWPVWERVLALLASGQLDPRPIVGRIAPLPEWKQLFDAMHAGDILKGVLTP